MIAKPKTLSWPTNEVKWGDKIKSMKPGRDFGVHKSRISALSPWSTAKFHYPCIFLMLSGKH
jgi:hypothetical protein